MRHIKEFKLFENVRDGVTTVERSDADAVTDGKALQLQCDGGILNYTELDNGTVFFEYVEVPEERRNTGIATKLLEHLFKMANDKKAYMDMTGFLEDGKKYLTGVISRLQKKYDKVEYSEIIAENK